MVAEKPLYGFVRARPLDLAVSFRLMAGPNWAAHRVRGW